MNTIANKTKAGREIVHPWQSGLPIGCEAKDFIVGCKGEKENFCVTCADDSCENWAEGHGFGGEFSHHVPQ